ncbi:unnamed protein product [Candidula unifasciata]|uniref:Uncharacterized protein n=1 Tax=Candidula unifasciata TaxID=100452 RepID=A0A8S4A4L3_9EUPU|nr:unnamed protein product [Candidula unifasciata]
MTKVRTILAEFCSPKDILAINRLGLIKPEERENQPIPWRHRLPIAERRGFVLSEMRASLKPPSKLTTRDKTKVVEAARSSVDSKMGECLLNNQTRQDTSLGSRIGKLNREKRRTEITHQQAQEIFMKGSRTLRLEPLILVERSPSEHAFYESDEGKDSEIPKLPGYMRPLRTGRKTPSMLTTIEAFTLETKKKRNIWEEVLQEKETPRFKSSTMPTIRLSEEEVSQLQLGHMLHKPTKESICGKRFRGSSSSLTDGRLGKTGALRTPEVKKDSLLVEAEPESELSCFITQLPQNCFEKQHVKQEPSVSKRLSKSMLSL